MKLWCRLVGSLLVNGREIINGSLCGIFVLDVKADLSGQNPAQLCGSDCRR